MTSSSTRGRGQNARYSTPVVDQFGLVVAVAATALWAVCALPALGGGAARADVPLTIAVSVVMLLAAVQWLALLRRFGASPPIPAALVGITVTLVAAAVSGQLGAVVGLVAGVVLAYCWRIVQETDSRLADVGYATLGVVVFGFLPAQMLLLRRLDAGPSGFYMYLAIVVVFEIVQSVLSRPARDGTRGADMSTLAAAVGATIAGVVGGAVAGTPVGAAGGLLVGAATAAGAAAGRACLPVLAPAPEVDGRRVRRRPLLLDALAPHLFAAPFAFLAFRMVAAG